MTLARTCVETYGKDRINSLTKYPSILTLHKMGERGILLDELSIPAPKGRMNVSEKLDGTNVRLIAFNDGSYLIGSREHILHHCGELYYSRDLDIVDVLHDNYGELGFLEQFMSDFSEPGIFVIYGELYGGKVGNSKNYGQNLACFRVFDTALFGQQEAHELLSTQPADIARWREREGPDGITYGQPFLSKSATSLVVRRLGLERPPSFSIELPEDLSIESVHQWLHDNFEQTSAAHSADATGKSEGVVVSSEDRQVIVKIRFEDYDRTIKQRRKK